MSSAVSPDRGAVLEPPNELDRLLDFDDAVEDFMRDMPGGSEQLDAANQEENRRDEDQEVQVKKKRIPVPKLDENRLLSDAGIPKLRKITKSRLKFKGKGHEYSDISRLLNTYQLWLDDLYPRAKFRDALTMVEKVGHSKRMQIMRRAWLDETKPNRRPSPDPNLIMSGANDAAVDAIEVGGAEHAVSLSSEAEENGGHGDAPEDDELDALLADSGVSSASHHVHLATNRIKSGPFADDDDDDVEDDMNGSNGELKTYPATDKSAGRTLFEEEPDEDELDALMAEQPAKQSNVQSNRQPPKHDISNDFADDEEAMASMGDW